MHSFRMGVREIGIRREVGMNKCKHQCSILLLACSQITKLNCTPVTNISKDLSLLHTGSRLPALVVG